MPIYDSIGQQYAKTRVPDSRIVQAIIDLLNLPKGSIIADIGAGTGSYTQLLANQGFSVYAVEPSLIMRSQAEKHPQIEWLTGYAEQGKRISNPIDTVVLGFTQSTNKFKITILSQGVGLTFQSLCG